jgi:hypothetical protein
MSIRVIAQEGVLEVYPGEIHLITAFIRWEYCESNTPPHTPSHESTNVLCPAGLTPLQLSGESLVEIQQRRRDNGVEKENSLR